MIGKDKIFWVKKIGCKVCGIPFESKMCRTEYLLKKETQTDFHIVYNEENPLLYQIMVCPGCLTAFRRDEWDNLRPFLVEKLVGIQSELKEIGGKFDFSKPRDFSLGVKSYELASLCYQTIGKKSDIVGGMYLRAAWIARDNKKIPLETHFLTLALKNYRQAYEKENVLSFGKFGECGLIYIIADLSLRLNIFEQALRFYSRVIEHPEIKRFRELERMVRDGWTRAKELRKSASENPEGDNNDKE